jgi:hypothetical protein
MERLPGTIKLIQNDWSTWEKEQHLENSKDLLMKYMQPASWDDLDRRDDEELAEMTYLYN